LVISLVKPINKYKIFYETLIFHLQVLNALSGKVLYIIFI